MKFFNEESFKQEEKYGLQEFNDLTTYSYFCEAVEQMLQNRLNEGYFQNFVDFVDDALKANAHYIKDSILLMSEENQKVAQNMVRTFANDFDHLIKQNKSWLAEHKAELSHYNGEAITPISAQYTYDHLGDKRIPNLQPLRDLYKNVSDTKKNVMSATSLDEKRLWFETEFENIKDEIRMDGYYASVRGESIRKEKYKIKAENFAQELFNFFRYGGDCNIDPINAANIRLAYARTSLYHTYIWESKKILTDINDIFNSLNGYLKDLAKFGTETYYDEKLTGSFNKYMAQVQDRLYHVSGIIIMAFAAKLDAISKSYQQDIENLHLAIEVINKGKGEVK